MDDFSGGRLMPSYRSGVWCVTENKESIMSTDACYIWCEDRKLYVVSPGIAILIWRFCRAAWSEGGAMPRTFRVRWSPLDN